jgi:hypothetical protein
MSVSRLPLAADGEARPRVASRSGALHDALLIAWIALIAADRIDLFGGGGRLLFTPFLALTPLVVGSELLRRHMRSGPITVSRSGQIFLGLVLVLLAIVASSVFVSTETAISAGRAFLLALQLIGTCAVLLAAYDRADLASVLDRGAVVGLILFALFDVLQAGALLGVVPETVFIGPASVHLMGYTYGSFLPRLSGMVADQNRSGIVLLFYAWAVVFRPQGRPRYGYVMLILLLMLATLSRSVFVAAFVTFVVLVLERRVRRVPPGALLGATLVLGLVTGAFMVSPKLRSVAENTLAPLVGRLSVAEGSSQVHLTVIGRGLDEGTKSIARVALGIGYGSAFTVLQDVFPGNRYGNFHSLYITMFAESGVFALLTILLIIGVPLVRGGPYRALVAGAAVFNMFYQATTDPTFWAMLALAWFTLPSSHVSIRPATDATAGT